MAFVEKSKGGFCVKKGNSGETLSCFRGKDAKKNANKEMNRLHRKNKPKNSARGGSASKKFGKGSKRRK